MLFSLPFSAFLSLSLIAAYSLCIPSVSPPLSLSITLSLPLALEAGNIKWSVWATVVNLASVKVAMGGKKEKKEVTFLDIQALPTYQSKRVEMSVL